MLSWSAIHFSLNRHALCGHAVERCLIKADCSRWSSRVVWVYRHDSHWVGGIVAELVLPRRWGTIGVLVKANLPGFDVEKVDHCLSDGNAELIA